MKTVAIIQARMGSTRLLGKVLGEIEGKPMLWHLINRLGYCKLLDNLVIATTTKKRDDILADFCRRNGIDFYRGSEEDVLDRYYHAAKDFGIDVIVRITSDCPLIDPEIVDIIIQKYISQKDHLDGASNILFRTYPTGLDTELVSSDALERCYNLADTKYQRSHVMPYIYDHLEEFNIYSLKNEDDLSSLRWTVDEEADMRFVKEVYARLYEENSIFYMREILDVLDKEPHLRKINKHLC